MSETTTVRKGDPWRSSEDSWQQGTDFCDATSPDAMRFVCCRRISHPAPHIAGDGKRVVAVWSDAPAPSPADPAAERLAAAWTDALNDAGVRQIADRLRDRLREHADDCICDKWVAHHSQVLATVVDALAAERAAEELDRFGDDVANNRLPWSLESVRIRAAALRAAHQPDSERNDQP